MELAALLEEARVAPPARRIDFRDPIAAYGIPAIEGIRPWLEDEKLAAFAVRVVERVGIDGEPAVASKTLRWARTRVPASVAGDVDWALQRLKAAAKPQPEKKAIPLAPIPAREPPRYDAAKRRRAR